jgi:H+/Cl- antiporter ClcA
MLKARIETVLAVVTGILAIVTLVWPTWIETLVGVDPDSGSGATEWLIVIALAGLAVASGLLARRDYQAARGRGARVTQR